MSRVFCQELVLFLPKQNDVSLMACWQTLHPKVPGEKITASFHLKMYLMNSRAEDKSS